jgi:hypothetical protein
MPPRSKLVAIHPVHGYAIMPQQDLKTIKRNARERNRVQAVNSCFENLRRRVPSAAVYKKMSKVNIIHHALEYIHQLMQVLQGEQISPGASEASSACSPASLYPSPSYAFQHPSSNMSTFDSSFNSLSSPHALEWAMRSQTSQMFPSPFLTPGITHHQGPHHLALMNSPSLSHCSPAAMGATHSPAISTPSHMDSCQSGFGQFSPVTPPSPDEEEDVLDAIVEWQSC